MVEEAEFTSIELQVGFLVGRLGILPLGDGSMQARSRISGLHHESDRLVASSLRRAHARVMES